MDRERLIYPVILREGKIMKKMAEWKTRVLCGIYIYYAGADPNIGEAEASAIP